MTHTEAAPDGGPISRKPNMLKPSDALRWVHGAARVQVIAGVANSLLLPSVRLLLAVPAAAAAPPVPSAHMGLLRLAEVLGLPAELTAPAVGADCDESEGHLHRWLALMLRALSDVDSVLSAQVAGVPQVRHHAGLLRLGGEPADGYEVLWPTHWPAALAQCLAGCLVAWRQLSQDMPPEQLPEAVAFCRSQWLQRRAALKRQLPSGFNAPRMLAAANALRLPVFWVERDLLQIGHGCRARWLLSSLTDATPSLGVSLARDKRRTNRLLQQGGVRVPQHVEVTTVEAAQAAALQLGWPVVVKPADQDRGEGARAGLRSPDQVRAAFVHASAVSKRVLVEQHVAGQEYRLTVVNGELIWAHERVPASVVGDGVSSLQALVERENALRREAFLSDPHGWVPIEMDSENLGYLAENGGHLQSIPVSGEVVRLQRIPAATTGGGGRACFDTLHPDNRLLAERAAQLLRLDIAGVDLIMPDITRSWREVGGAVTEVNAIPQISVQTCPTLAQRLLQKLLPSGGRIPLLLVLADGVAPVWVPELVGRLATLGLQVGMTTADGLQIGPSCIRGPRASLWDDVRALQLDPGVGVLVVVGHGDELLQTGLPFDAVHALVVQTHRPAVLRLLLPYAKGLNAVVGSALCERYGPLLQGAGADWQVWQDSPDFPEAQLAALTTWLAGEALRMPVADNGDRPGMT